MKLNRYIKPIAYSILALSVSAVALNSALASQYNNGFTDEIPTRERRVRTQYYHKAPNTFWGETSPYAGEIDTRVQVGQNRLSHSRIEAKPQQAAAPVPCASGHVDNSIFPGGGCGTTMLEATKDQDNSMIPGQGCGGQGKSCEKIVPVSASPCTLNPKACKARKARVKALDPNTIRYNFIQNYTLKPRHDVYTSIHDKCGKYAPIQLEWVDFRLNEEDINGSLAQKLGNYRFRIFGCRRFTKEALLNQGRLMEQNMRLINVFDNTLKDCFNIVKIPDDICVEDNPSPLPDYLITAEITNYFMNICDKYNWDESAMENRRIGSSEITVRWKITDINRTHVYWSGETDGYGNLTRGEENGEVILVERAFAEAKAKAPCILFIDEIDSVCRNRSMPNIPSHAMSTTTAFLTGYNSLGDSKKPVIFIGATNYPNLVDNAMLDRVELIKLPLPDVKVRAKTFEMFFNQIMQNEPGFTYENMAEETYNYNQRDIKRLCIQIRDLVKKDVQSIYPDEHESVEALKSGSYTLSKEIFEKALNLYVPSRKDDIIRTLDEWDKDRERRSEE